MVQTAAKKTNWRGRFIRYAPLIFWVGVIFFLSSRAGSMSNTSLFIRPILQFFFPNAPEEILLVYHGYVRKFAHFAEYAVLAFWASRAFVSSSVIYLQKYWFAFAFALVLLVAAADETNQSFLTSRTSSPFDVIIDCFGGLMMILFFTIFKKYFVRRF